MTQQKIRTLPTTMVTGYWDDGSISDVPERIKIVMSDGKRVYYRIEVKQPRPDPLSPSEMAEMMARHIYGGKHAKKSR